jgi:glycosyltransferase involved in cell wall biosynthesis
VVDFSVVIPTVRRRELLLQAVASVVGQTLPPAEVIVVVDRPSEVPSDGTEDALAVRFPSVRVIHSGGRGDAAARQAGIEQATGGWVCFLDDDDLWHREKLALTAAHIQSHPGCAAVRGTVWFFGENSDVPGELFGLTRDVIAADLDALHAHAATHPPVNDFAYLDIEGHSLELMLERNRGIIHTSAVRRDILQAARPVPETLQAGADWLLLTEVASLAEWCFIPTGMAFYRLHAGQFSRDPRIARSTAEAMALQWDRHADHVPRPLESYAPVYVPTLRQALWTTVRLRRWRDARVVASASSRLLPRWRDRAAVMVPGRIAHRVGGWRGSS